MKDDNGALARRIEALRIQKDMGYPELGAKVGMPYRTLYNALYVHRSITIANRIDDFIRALDVDDKTAEELQDMAGDVLYGSMRLKMPRKPRTESPDDDECACCAPRHTEHRYDAILKAIKDGESDGKILRDWPELTSDVLAVYHKIVDGKLSGFAKNGGMYDKDIATALENFRAIAFRTGSLSHMTDNFGDYDGLGRW